MYNSQISVTLKRMREYVTQIIRRVTTNFCKTEELVICCFTEK